MAKKRPGVAQWIAEAAVPVGFGLLTLQAIVELIGLRKAEVFGLGASHE